MSTPAPFSRMVLASGNAGKLTEFRQMFATANIHIVPQGDLNVDDADETGQTFVENALLKARHAARMTGLPAMADDSGICVPALNGAPGLYSARYAGTHGDSAANNAKLLQALDDKPKAERRAFFMALLVWLPSADDPAPLIAEGRWYGHILAAPQGRQGFGYDPLFQPDNMAVSAAELSPDMKNKHSHRGQAIAKLKTQLISRGVLPA